MYDSIISCRGVSRNYGDIRALGEIDLDVGQGEIFGLIGPDGSGKTSLFRLIATLMIPDSGSIYVMGYDTVRDFRMIRKKLGYMPGRFSLYPDLTVEENLGFYASVYKSSLKDNYHLIEDVYSHIEPFRKRRAGKLSGGMKQKLALSCALIHSPQILILDEPTTGVDAVSRREFWELLKTLREKGMTILVSTPYMDEAKRCDRIALFQEGKLMKLATPRSLLLDMPVDLFYANCSDRYGMLMAIRESGMADQAYLSGQNVHFTLKGSNIDILRDYLESRDFEDLELGFADADIEDCFIHLMNTDG